MIVFGSVNRPVRGVGLAAAVLLGACAPERAAERVSPDGPLRVVATFSIVGDWVAQVGGESILSTTLVPAGADAHAFNPTPADAVALAEADVVFQVGLGFEPWLDTLMRDTRAERVALGALVVDPDDQHPADDDEHGHDQDDDHGHDQDHLVDAEHDHSGLDPHVWQDPVLAAEMVQVIRDTLVALDPAGGDGYTRRAESYLAELHALDAWIHLSVDSIPAERRILVTLHDSFGYFGRRYGFDTSLTLAGGFSTELGGVSGAELAGLVTAIRDRRVPAIFPENVAEAPLLRRLAEEADVAVAEPLLSDALTGPDGPASTYLDLMRHNTQVMVAALR